MSRSGYVSDAERGVEYEGHFRGGLSPDMFGTFEWQEKATWTNPLPQFVSFVLLEEQPVVMISRNDAQAFCRFYGLRLLTESEWEYCCRAGSRGAYPWGDRSADAAAFANVFDKLGLAVFPSWRGSEFDCSDGDAMLSIVCKRRGNALGLYDFVGNAAEWCATDAEVEAKSLGASTVLCGASDDFSMHRGGSWCAGPPFCRCAFRARFFGSFRSSEVGFRVCVDRKQRK